MTSIDSMCRGDGPTTDMSLNLTDMASMLGMTKDELARQIDGSTDKLQDGTRVSEKSRKLLDDTSTYLTRLSSEELLNWFVETLGLAADRVFMRRLLEQRQYQQPSGVITTSPTGPSYPAGQRFGSTEQTLPFGPIPTGHDRPTIRCHRGWRGSRSGGKAATP